MDIYFTEDQICIALYNGDMLHIPESQLANPIPIVLEQYKMSHSIFDLEMADGRHLLLNTAAINYINQEEAEE